MLYRGSRPGRSKIRRRGFIIAAKGLFQELLRAVQTEMRRSSRKEDFRGGEVVLVETAQIRGKSEATRATRAGHGLSRWVQRTRE